MSNINTIDFGNESGSEDEADFNPAQEVGSDDEATSDHAAKAPRSPRAPSRRASHKEGLEDGEGEENAPEDNEARDNDDDDDDDDDDDEDEDDEDDDEIADRPRKRRRGPRNQFLDLEAEVNDEDEEGDDDDEEADHRGFIAEEHPDDVADLPPGADTDDRRHRELDRQRERAQQMDAEKQAEILRERYGRRQVTATDATLVPKRLLLPSVDDPSIWGVRCKPGKEREVVFSILKRVEERAFGKSPLPIISALERGGTMLGYVYIEARKQSDILASLEGIMNVYPRTKMVLVPIKEMPDLLRVTKTEQLQPGGYVRLKRGKYAGDLAQIDDVETNGLEVVLRIVPRLDYGQNEDANAPVVDNGSKGDAQKRKRYGNLGSNNPAARPPPRLFNDAEAKKKHSKYLQSQSTFDRKHWTYLNDTYINGFLIKEFKIQHLQTTNVNPTLEEVTKFAAGAEDGTENLDLAALAASLKNNSANDNYLPGDMVEVYEGEQQGVCGKAVSVRGDIVTLNVTEGELRGQSIEVPVKGLRKRFKEGDHVKVIGGSRFRDEVGMVVRIKDDRVTILSDMSMQEITVFSKDLREASDSGVAGGLGLYDIHDLVQLDPASVGCVIKVDRESLRVLDQNGSLRSVMPSQISNKIERRKNAVATDRNGIEIRQDDTVREIEGDRKQGMILHIHRSFLFLHNREQTENSGIFVVRAANVATVAAKGARVAQANAGGPDLTRMNPAMQRNGGTNGNGAMPPPRSFGRDPITGRTVHICKGPYKGLLGIVKDTTDTEARVELHTKSRTVTVAKDTLKIKDTVTGTSIAYADFVARGRGMGGRGGSSSAMPAREAGWAGGRTPMASNGMADGGRTPGWGVPAARTPAWSASGTTVGKTPRWGQEQSSAAYGARTPAWNPAIQQTGGRTPAWNAGGQTAYGHGTTYNSSSDAFGGSKTPAYSADSSRTPAYGASWARPQDAPTPAAPTPANGYLASTPAASAPTPYGGAPETPAWGGDDDGPRYDESPSP